MKSIESLVADALMVGFLANETADAHQGFAAGRANGAILFRRNAKCVSEAGDWIQSIVDVHPSPHSLIFGIDQEGGRVARLDAPILKLPPMQQLMTRFSTQEVESIAHCLGSQLTRLGFTINFAPVMDVNTNPQNPVIGDRAFSSDADEVIRYAKAFSAGLQRGGIFSCGKHFPGHGDTDVDSHLVLPTIKHSKIRLDSIEMRPFRELSSSVDAMMSAHIDVPALDPDHIATCSSTVLNILKRDFGFSGPIFSDDLEMKGLSPNGDAQEIAENGLRSIEAGCDILLICSRLDAWQATYERLVDHGRAHELFRARLEDASRRSASIRRAQSASDRKQLEQDLQTITEKFSKSFARYSEISPAVT